MAPIEPQSRHNGARPSSNRAPEAAGASDAAAGQRRNEGQSHAGFRNVRPRSPLTASESWVEIASQPSSSSLSSMGDEIVTTGLRIGSNSYPPRRRRLHQQPLAMPTSYVIGHAAAQAGTSSQEEYDESESEEDRVMTSSTEAVHPAASLPRQQTAVRTGIDTDTDSDDENATVLRRPSGSPTFRPQPNAFSHPPSHLTHRHSTSSAHPYRPSHSRPSMPSRSHTRPHRNAPDYMSPSFQADNEAALRASLTTLLSCAAAARGLSKKEDHTAGGPGIRPAGAGAGVIPSSQPMELRLVPESELMAEDAGPTAPGAGPVQQTKLSARTASNSSAPSAPSSASSRTPALQTERPKRAAAPQTKHPRATKKKRSGVAVEGETTTFISPTLLTWAVSAGVVVLVSVVGFGAGYVIGREVGRQEGALGSLSSAGTASNASLDCGQELVKSTGTLRRFRWGYVGKTIAA